LENLPSFNNKEEQTIKQQAHTVSREVEFSLLDERKAQLMDEVAATMKQVEDIQDRLRMAKEEAKKIGGLMEHVAQLSLVCRSGKEMRPVVFEVLMDVPEVGKKTLVAPPDSGLDNIVEEITEDERQRILEFQQRGDQAVETPGVDEMHDPSLVIPENVGKED